MRAAGEQQDCERLAQLAHDLVGMAGGAGFGDFTEPSRQLEKHARDNDLAHIKSLVSELEILASRVDIPTRSSTTPTEGANPTQTSSPLGTVQ